MPLNDFNPLVAGSGPTVLFVHGAAGNPLSNFPFLPDFANRYRVIAPHVPGSGGVPLPPEPLSTQLVADQLGRQLEEAGVHEYAVVGYSMGCSIAIELAAAFPDRVKAVALTAGFAHARPSLRNTVEVWDHLQQGDPKTLGRFVLQTVLKAETLDLLGTEWINTNAVKTAGDLATGTRAHLDLIQRVDVRDSLARTSQPLLVLAPRYDILVDPAHSEDIVSLRPDAVTVALNAGHAVGEDDPVAWRRALDRFLRSRPPTIPPWSQPQRW